VTQADLDAGREIVHWVTACVGVACTPPPPPSGECTTEALNELVDCTVSKLAPAISLGKRLDPAASATQWTSPGQRVPWRIAVTNESDLTLTNVTIKDELPSAAVTCPYWPSGTTGTLKARQTVTCSAEYELTQADLNGSSLLTNVASVLATPPGVSWAACTRPDPSACVSASGSATISLLAYVELRVSKSGPATLDDVQVGDPVDYEVTVTNDGNRTATGVKVGDDLLGNARVSCAWDGGVAGTLAPGEKVVCTGSYALTQADLDAGSVTNWATACAGDGCALPVPPPPPEGGPACFEDRPADVACVTTLLSSSEVVNTGTTVATGGTVASQGELAPAAAMLVAALAALAYRRR
jgi:uncharacterized repeat protein (TIGR01451 family)